MENIRRSSGYQALLVGLLSLNFGILFFDRNALNFLMPFVQPDLKLSNFQVGMLGAALSLTWAISGYLIGRYSDRTGRRKSIIVIAGIAFSICSFVSGIAASFMMLLGARLLMGFAEGGVLPISQSLTASEVAPEKRGLAMGVMQNLGSNTLGSAIAPLVLVPIALAYSWREAFYLAAIPGMMSAVLIWFLIKEPAAPVARETQERLSIAQAFAERNILLCAMIAVLLVAYLVICWGFLPIYLTQMRGFDPDTMSWLMATLGISAGIGSFVIPAISDYAGRKPVMILVPLIGVILPVAAMFFHGSTWLLAAIFFFGWALNGVFPMFMATIPSETVNPKHTATALGLVMGTGEILGGVIGPLAAGKIADLTNLNAPMWIMLGLAIVAGLLALGLRETAPRALARSGKLDGFHGMKPF
jgi:MFS transporter, ACS family, hexuronate transporter